MREIIHTPPPVPGRLDRRPILVYPDDGIAKITVGAPDSSQQIAVIDLIDLPRVETYSWYLGGVYPRSVPTTMIQGVQVALGRYIKNAQRKQRIEYLDGDPFNCRRANLHLHGEPVLTDSEWQREPARAALIAKRERLLKKLIDIDEELWWNDPTRASKRR